ncbi:hypothetical protein OJAV_G00063840 [Oryzias javanicus]|uniref:Uncharacterized protein n=1 Tax=Oryzias javanicus TaxID=123683 RepID=A0A3S2PCU9_ORYJA|nr:hypothetical protein OJAV_G00063840 [Oryzias javanicus]
MYHENATHVLHDATAVHQDYKLKKSSVSDLPLRFGGRFRKGADLCVSEFEVHVARVDCDDVLCDQLAMEKDGGASPHQMDDSVDLPDKLM